MTTNQEKMDSSNWKLEKEVDDILTKHFAIEDFRQRLENIHEQEIETKGKIIQLGKKTWYWSAASIAGFIGGSYLVYQNSHSFDNLYNNYYMAYEPNITFRGNSSNVSVQAIVTHYNKGEFSNAIALIESMESNQELSPNVLLMKGCALMELQQFKAAIHEFSKFNNKTYTLYTESSYWYKALCFIKLERTDEALAQLDVLIENGVSYQERAKKLRNKIGN
jgi:hypothetical protein